MVVLVVVEVDSFVLNYTIQMVKYSAAQCRDDTRWRRVKLRGTIVEYKNDNDRYVPVLQVKPSTYGRGLFALQSYDVGDYVAAYFGKLVRKDTHPENSSDMVIQSGLRDYVIKGRPATSISGAVFVNAVRGKDKKKQNVRISVKRVTLASKQGALQKLEFDQMRELHPGVQVMARGNVIPVYVCTKKIRMGDEILTDYNWTNKEWQRNLKRKQ